MQTHHRPFWAQRQSFMRSNKFLNEQDHFRLTRQNRFQKISWKFLIPIVKIWDILNKKCVATIKGAWGGVETLQFDQNTLVSGTNHRDISAYDMVSLQRIRRLKGHNTSVFSLKMNGNLVCSGSRDQVGKGWEMC
jgi:WD40 repeat protein